MCVTLSLSKLPNQSQHLVYKERQLKKREKKTQNANQRVKSTPRGRGWMWHEARFWVFFSVSISSIHVFMAQSIIPLGPTTTHIYLVVDTVGTRELNVFLKPRHGFLRCTNYILCTILRHRKRGSMQGGILMDIRAVWLFSRKSMVGIVLVLCLLPRRKP